MLDRRSKRVSVFGYLLLALTTHYAVAKSHPVAVVKPVDDVAFLLTSEGTVFSVRLQPNNGGVVGSFRTSTRGIVSDLAFGVADGQPSLFVASSQSNGVAIAGLIQQFTTDGRLLKTWTVGHVVQGITFDPGSRTLYFSSGDSPELFALSLGAKSPVFVTEVAGASRLGALTLDASSRKLYVGDQGTGSVYAVGLTDHRAVRVTSVGTPQAILMADGGKLLVADAGRHQILSLLSGNATALTPRSSFVSPAGLAWMDASHQQVIVADQSAGTVSLVDATSGATLNRLQLP